MKIIQAKNRKGDKFDILLDDDVYEIYKNTTLIITVGGYVVRQTSRKTGKQKQIRISREIMNCPKHMKVDHKYHNKFDNQRCNLRIVTTSQNGMNRSSAFSAYSKYLGVSIERGTKKYTKKNGEVMLYPYFRWRARIWVNGKNLSLGSFKTEIEAALAYNKAAVEYFGEYAHLNIIKENGETKGEEISEHSQEQRVGGEVPESNMGEQKVLHLTGDDSVCN